MMSQELMQVSHRLNEDKVFRNLPVECDVDDPSDAKPVDISLRTGRPKRRKAARACTNCQRTHLTCDDNRPCERCIKRGCADSCMDGERKTPKRTRFKNNKSSNYFEYATDLLASQGPQGTLALSQHQPQLHHLQHSNISPNNVSDSRITDFSKLLWIPESPEPTQPKMHLSDAHLHYEHSEIRADSSSLNNSALKRENSDPYCSPTKHQFTSHISFSESPGSNDHSHCLESFQLVPGYYRPIESFPLPFQSPLQSYFESLYLPKKGFEEYSVMSAMLDRRGEEGEEERSDTQHASDTSNEYDMLPGSNDEVSTNAMPWMELLTNPFVSAHNEPSRRFSYNYEHTDPSEVYKRVTEPFPNRQSFYKMIQFLKDRLDQAQYNRLTSSLSKLKIHFDSISRPLSTDDNLFVEQSFQRSLFEEEKQFALTPVPCLVWRRTGVVTAVSPRFIKLTQWTEKELKSDFIMRAMDNESTLRYFEHFQSASLRPTSDFRFDCTLVSPFGTDILTEAEIIVRKDLFNMPLIILGKFWTKS